MNKNIITENRYSVEQSISGYWRLMKDGEVIYDDSACNELNEDKETAEAFFVEYLGQDINYNDTDITVREDGNNYYINFNTGLDEGIYPKADWTIEKAIKDQENIYKENK